MRILIDARTIADRFPGIGRYTYNLIQALSQYSHDHEIVALTSPAASNTRYNLAALPVRWLPTTARLFSAAEQWQLPSLLRSEQIDLFHATYYIRPYFGIPCPVVTTLYDTIPRHFPETVSWRARMLFDLLHRLAIWRSDAILTISDSARADLIAAYQIADAQMSVTPLAADPQFKPQASEQMTNLRARYQLPERYVLTLGSDKPHKNLAGLLRIWEACQAQMPMPLLVIAGHRNPHSAALAPQRGGITAGTHELPNIPADDMPALYAGAELFIFPSLYEGFGLPALEAMACGTPVICGQTSSLPEVVGEAGILIQLEDTQACARIICATLENKPLQQQLSRAGLAQASNFSWEAVARGTLAAYQRVRV